MPAIVLADSGHPDENRGTSFRLRRADRIFARAPEREREILALIAGGCSNQGICETLWLSPKTVETHTRSLFLKLDLGNVPRDNRRVLAALTYLRAGGPDG